MTTRPTDILSQRLADLRVAYADHLPERVRAIEEAAAALRSDDAEAIRSLYHLVHRLTGSSAVYGFPELSRASAALEELLLAAWTGQAPSARNTAATLAPLVAAIKEKLAAARAAAGAARTGPDR